jgi:TolB-like protein
VFYSQQRAGESHPAEPGRNASIVIAVLPFDIQGASADDEPLAFGVADEILSALSRNPSISVIAGNSSFQFRGDSKNDLTALSERLNISHVVDGSLRRSRDGLRVGVHLIDIDSGLVKWSDVVTRPEQEIYSIPSEVAAAVQTALGTDPVSNRERATAPDPEAYAAYLLAKSLLREVAGPSVDMAIGQLEKAVELDPNLSEAWSTLAMTRLEKLLFQGPGGPDLQGFDPSERLAVARHDANMALALDPDSIDALLALAIIDYSDQAVSLVKTVSLVRSLLVRAPNQPKVNFRMGLLMGQVGRFNEASDYLARALELDPLTILNAQLYADALLSSGRIEEAMEFIRIQGAYEHWRRAYTALIRYLLSADYQTARDVFTKLGPREIFFLGGVVELPSINVDSLNTRRLSQILARLIDVAESGDISQDASIASDLIEAADEGLIFHFYAAQLLAAAGYHEQAFELVRERLAAGDTLIRQSGILARPAFEEARQGPGVMAWFGVTEQLDYWLETDSWPDFCSDPELPYDCKQEAKRVRRD